MTDRHDFTLRCPNKHESSEACAWLAFTLVGGVLPVWGIALLDCVFARTFAFSDYVGHAEFALYTAAISSGTLFLVFRDFRKYAFPYRSWFGLACVTLLVVSTLLFGAVVFSADKPSIPALGSWTIGIFSISLLVSVLAMLIDLQLSSAEDPSIEANAQINALGSKVRARRGGKNEA